MTLNHNELIDIKWLENGVSDDQLVRYALYGDANLTSGQYSPIDLGDGWTYSLTGYNHNQEQDEFIQSIFLRLDPLLAIDFQQVDFQQGADIAVYRSNYNTYMNVTLGWPDEGFGGGFAGYSYNWTRDVVWRDIHENDPFLSMEKNVIVHEIGHALSLDHPGGDGYNPAWTQADSIMSYNDGEIREGLYYEWFSDLDIQALQSIWGVEDPSDNIRPTIEIVSSINILKRGDNAVITFTLSENSWDFKQSDINVSGGTLDNWQEVSNSVYKASFTPNINSIADAIISVKPNSFRDASGNLNIVDETSRGTLSIPVDTVSPSETINPSVVITSETSSLEQYGTTNITFTLSADSHDFDFGDVEVLEGSLSNWEKISAKKYTAIFEQTTLFDATISVNSNAFTDLASNLNSNGASQTILAYIPYVYRLRNDSTGRYLFSSNSGEIDIITGAGWTNEGIAYKSPAQSSTKTSSLHRYDMNGSGHFYTANEYEKGIIDATTAWRYEGVAFNVYSHEQVQPEVNTVAVKRYLNSDLGIHLYSTSSYEQDILNAAPEWLYEGIAWYGEAIL